MSQHNTRDYHSKPFQVMVVMGESTVEGGGWVRNSTERFADILAELINACQETPVTYYNKGIGANSISPRSPGYEKSAKPSALERYETDVISLIPDLFVLCYGLNDMRAGMPVNNFTQDMQTIIEDVKAACDPVIILTTVYHMTGFKSYAPYDKGGIRQTCRYNNAIHQLAKENDCLLADVWEGLGLADWLINPDGCHANMVGNLIIAHRIFETIAKHCSGISADIHRRDATTNHGKNTMQIREAVEDAFDPWWLSET